MLGFIQNLTKDISTLPQSIRGMVESHSGLLEKEFYSLLSNPSSEELHISDVPSDSSVSFYHDKLEEYADIGRQHKIVHCIYAGELDSISGEPLALARVPGLGISLLAIKILQTPIGVRTLVVVPPHLRQIFEDHVACLGADNQGTVNIVEQDSVYLLTPDYRLVKDELNGCGSGGCLAALSKNGVLKELVEQGTQYIYFTDVRNVLATPSYEILGHHIKHGSKLTFEVVRRKEEQKGSVLVDSENGINLVDPVRLNIQDFSPYSWGGTGSMIMGTDVDVSAALPRWRRVRRVHKNYVTVCYQRFLEELSEAFTSSFVGIARNERFLKVDSPRDMEEVSKRITIKLV